MTESIPLAQAAAQLSEIVQRARSSHERVVLTEDGAPVAAVISIEELAELQRAQDERDIAICERANANWQAAITHEEFMAMLDAEDAASA